jgi:chromosome partitioning protein
MRTLAIAHLKGGTGKTATCHALGTILAAERGRQVLLVDCDPQASLTGACGIRDSEGVSLAEALDGVGPDVLELLLYRIILRIAPGLDLLPADIALARTEQLLTTTPSRALALRNALRRLGSKYDVAILDCPANLGLLTTNALAAADAVLIPTKPNVLDLRALSLFLDSLERTKKQHNPQLETLGIVVTFFEGRLIHHKRILDAMQGLGLPVMDVVIGRTVRVAEASAESQSIVQYAPQHKQAEAYRQLADTVDAWLGEPYSVRRRFRRLVREDWNASPAD